jgi:hypothetical protein
MIDGSWRAGAAGAETRPLFHDAFDPAEAVPLLQSSFQLSFPQPLKPGSFRAICGTTEVVPFQNINDHPSGDVTAIRGTGGLANHQLRFHHDLGWIASFTIADAI